MFMGNYISHPHHEFICIFEINMQTIGRVINLKMCSDACVWKILSHRVGFIDDGYKCFAFNVQWLKALLKMQHEEKECTVCCKRKVSVIIFVCHPLSSLSLHQAAIENAKNDVNAHDNNLPIEAVIVAQRELTWKFILWTASRYAIVVRLPVRNGLQHFIGAGCELRKCKSDEHVREPRTWITVYIYACHLHIEAMCGSECATAAVAHQSTSHEKPWKRQGIET